MAGSNCIGPSAPAPLAPEWTPGRSEVPLADSTVPMAASTVQGRPGQVAAASWYSASIAAGTRRRCRSPPAPLAVPPVPEERGTDHPGRPGHHGGGEDQSGGTDPRRRGALIDRRNGRTRARSRAQGRHTWAMKSTMQDAPLLISDILRHGQQLHGDSKVITVEAGGHRSATFDEVAVRAEKLAAALTRLGIRDGDRVGTFCWNNQGHLEAYLAVPCMGAVLHTLNIRLSADQLAYVINHAEDRVIIVDASLIPLLAAVRDELKTVETIIVVGEGDTTSLGATLPYEALLAAEEPGFDWPELDERSAAAMCYTSGTTGDPKGVVYSHRSTWLHTMAEQSASSVGMTEKDRILIIVPMFHANAWGTPYARLDGRHHHDHAPDVPHGRAPGRRDQRVPPDAGLRRAHHLERPAAPEHADRLLLGAGHHRRGRRRAPGADRGVRGALRRHDHSGLGHDRDQPDGGLRAAPRPPAEWPRRHVLQDQGRAGGRRRRGPRGRRGRHRAARATASRWGSSRSADPGSPARTTRTRIPSRFHDGWLRTGDIGTLDQQGYMTISDRTKDVIKSGGEWISSVELENEVMAHPDVFEAAVIAVPDSTWSERPLVVVVPKPGLTPSPSDLVDFLAGRVPRWWLPEQWVFVDEIPKTSVGKFNKRLLRAGLRRGRLRGADRGRCPSDIRPTRWPMWPAASRA